MPHEPKLLQKVFVIIEGLQGISREIRNFTKIIRILFKSNSFVLEGIKLKPMWACEFGCFLWERFLENRQIHKLSMDLGPARGL